MNNITKIEKQIKRRYFLEILSIVIVAAVVLFLAGFLFFKPNKTGNHMNSNENYTVQLELVKNYCKDGKIVFEIRNLGDKKITSQSIKCISVDNPCGGSCNFSDFLPNQVNKITIEDCDKGAHTYKLIGPFNTSLSMGAECH